MNYPFRFPFSDKLSQLGFTLTINIDVYYDPDVEVYIATSKDIPGLVLESESFAGLEQEVKEAIPNLLSFSDSQKHLKTSVDLIYTDHIALA